jgi:hypothetical protein
MNHPLMKNLQQQHPEGVKQLADMIVNKAEGVFLWVKLVVKLLIKGLEDGDSLIEL